MTCLRKENKVREGECEKSLCDSNVVVVPNNNYVVSTTATADNY